MSSLKSHISLFDKSFSLEKSEQYKVYLEINLSGLKYVVLDTETTTFIGFEEYRFNNLLNDFALINPLNDIINTTPLLQKQTNKILISIINQRSTLIPNAIFQQEKLATYHQFNFTKNETDQFFYDDLINLSAKNIYSISDYLITAFKKYNNVSFHHFSSSLIEAAILHSKKTTALSLIDIHVLPNTFQIIAIKNQQLELYNSFEYQTSEDFIYYLLFVLEQLKIDNQKATIRLIGEVEKNSTIYNMLHQYINTINFGKRTNNINYSYILEDLPHHFHYSIFNQFLCE